MKKLITLITSFALAASSIPFTVVGAGKGEPAAAAKTNKAEVQPSAVVSSETYVTTTAAPESAVTTTTFPAVYMKYTPIATLEYKNFYELEISSLPDKTEYKIGEELDLSGLSLKEVVYTDDGSSRRKISENSVTDTVSKGSMYSGVDENNTPIGLNTRYVAHDEEFDNTKPGEYVIEIQDYYPISWNGIFTTEFTVRVLPDDDTVTQPANDAETVTTTTVPETEVHYVGPITHETFTFKTVKTYPTKTVYEEGEDLEFKGILVDAAGSYGHREYDDFYFKNILKPANYSRTQVTVTDKDNNETMGWDFNTLPAGDYTVNIKGQLGDYYSYNLCRDVDITYDVTIKGEGDVITAPTAGSYEIHLFADNDKIAGDTDFTVDVVDEDIPVKINKLPDKLTYVQAIEDKLDLKGISVDIGGYGEDLGAAKFTLLSDKLYDSPASMLVIDDSDFDPTRLGTYEIRIGASKTGISEGNTFTVKVVPDTSYPDDMEYGDTNCDGKVDISDAVLLMQSLANPSAHRLTAMGKKNADVYNTGDGITVRDANVIQKYLLRLERYLPVIEEKHTDDRTKVIYRNEE